MRLHAFQGIRFAAPAAEAGRLVAPPSDALDATARGRPHAAAEHHFAHLCARAPEEGAEADVHATHLHTRWLADGTLAREEQPALYPYVIHLPGGRRRFGICGLVDFEDPASGILRPLERTTEPIADDGAVQPADRLDLEPALIFARDDGALDRLVAVDVRNAEPLVEHVDASENLHRLYRIDDPERITVYRQALASCTACIAEGYERYAASRRHAAKAGAAEGTTTAAKLAIVTSLTSPGLAIDPIHRALEALPDLDAARSCILRADLVTPADGAAFAALVDAAPAPSLGVVQHGGAAELWRLDPDLALEPAATVGGRLSVVLLQDVLFPAIGLGEQAATDGTVIYRADPQALWQQVVSGELAVGLFLPPMSPADFATTIAEDGMLPPRSTRFAPAVMSGLVWASHDATPA